MHLPWGPRSFHRKFVNRMMHREWRGFRRTERGIFYMTGSTAPSALELIWNTSVIVSIASLHYDSAAALLLIDSAAQEQQAQLRT